MTDRPQPTVQRKFNTFVLEESPDLMYRIDPDFRLATMQELISRVKATLKRLETQP